MSINPKTEIGTTVESASVATLVASWVSATGSRMGLITELAFAEARLAAISALLMVTMGMLSAVLILSSWGLMVAGLVAAISQFGVSLWITLLSLSLLHVLGAWLLWRGAVGLSRYLEFSATRRQFQKVQEVSNDVDTATTTG